jgi:uncharacterized protein (DUF433 family)
MATALKGIIHGKSIELTEETGLPEGQEVSVQIQPISARHPQAEPPAPWWLARLEVNPAVRPGKFVIKGTSLLADELVARVEEGWTQDKLLQTYPALAPEDVAAVREYARVPVEMRRCFGAWAEDAEELDQYLEWNRQQRKVSRGRMDD